MESLKTFQDGEFHYLEKNIFLSVNESKKILFLGYIDTVHNQLTYLYHPFKYISNQDKKSLFLIFEYEAIPWSVNARIVDKFTIAFDTIQNSEYDNDRIVYNRCSITITKSLLNILKGKTVYIDKCFDSSLNGYDPKRILVVSGGYEERYR